MSVRTSISLSHPAVRMLTGCIASGTRAAKRSATGRRMKYSAPGLSPCDEPALTTTRSPGANSARLSSSPPMIRIGAAGTVSAAFGPHAISIAGSRTAGGATGSCAPAIAGLKTVTIARPALGISRRVLRLIGWAPWFLQQRSLDVRRLGAGFLEIFALLEFLDQFVQVGERFGRAIDLDQRLREIEVDRVAIGELWILLQQRDEALDRAGIPLHRAEVVEPDAVFRLAEAVLRLAQVPARLRQQRTVRKALDEGRQLRNRLARFRLVTLRAAHLVVVRHAELVLRVIGAVVRRVEREELAVFVHRQHVRLDRPLAEEAVGDPELRVGAVGALRIAVHQLPEILARREPATVVERLGAALPEKLVRLERPRGGTLRRGRTGSRRDEQ